MPRIRDRESNIRGTALGRGQTNPADNNNTFFGDPSSDAILSRNRQFGGVAAASQGGQITSLQDLIGRAGGQFSLAEDLQGEALAATPDAEFNTLQRLLAPGQDRERAELESRLFQQGRLGGTGGANEQRALSEAQGNERLQAAVQSIRGSRDERNQARTSSNQAIQNALSLTQSGVAGLQGLQEQNFQQILGLNQAQIQQLLAAKSLEPQSTGREGFGRAIGSIIGGAGGAFFGSPAAGAAGASAGGSIGGLFDR